MTPRCLLCGQPAVLLQVDHLGNRLRLCESHRMQDRPVVTHLDAERIKRYRAGLKALQALTDEETGA